MRYRKNRKGLAVRFALTTVFLTAAIVALAVLVFHDTDPLTQSPLALHHILILALLLSAFFAAPPNLRQVGQSVLLWGGIGLAAIVGYSFRAELGLVAERVKGEFSPGKAALIGEHVEIVRERDGHFHVMAEVGETRATFLIDTGASMVVLTHETARAAGLDLTDMRYLQPVSTANGLTTVAATKLDVVRVGNITLNNVEAAIAQPGLLTANLLGLSFLNRLSRWGVEHNRFVMEE